MLKSLALGILLGLICSVVSAQEPQSKSQELELPKITKERPMSFWMAKKLDYSKELLEALTSGDFKSLETYATHMRAMGELEGFMRSGSPEYAAQLHMFEMSNTDLITQARAGNLEGATLAFNHLTSSCVACHAQLRKK
jgi:hypothetical protein